MIEKYLIFSIIFCIFIKIEIANGLIAKQSDKYDKLKNGRRLHGIVQIQPRSNAISKQIRTRLRQRVVVCLGYRQRHIGS